MYIKYFESLFKIYKILLYLLITHITHNKNKFIYIQKL